MRERRRRRRRKVVSCREGKKRPFGSVKFVSLALDSSSSYLGLQPLPGRIPLAKPDPQMARLVVVGELRLHFFPLERCGSLRSTAFLLFF